MSFVASKLFWALVAPGNLLLILLALASLRLARSRGRRGRGLAAAVTLVLAAVAVLPLGQWLLRPLKSRFPVPAPPARVDGIIVLGGAVEPTLVAGGVSQPVLNDAAERIFEALALARRHPEAMLLLSGGNGALLPGRANEGAQTRALFLAQGIAAERILVESRSRNTAENAAFSQALVRPASGQVWLLVTSAWHMPRAYGCFRHIGWEVTPDPVDFHPTTAAVVGFALAEHLSVLDLAVREWIGLAAYRLMGRTDSVFPGP